MPVSIYWLFAPLILIACGFALTNHYRPVTLEKWDVGTVFVWLMFAAICWWIEILTKMTLWQGYMTSGETPKRSEPAASEPKQYRNMTNEAYNQTVTAVKFDAEKNCFKILLSMHEQGMDVNLTEDFWLKPVTLRSGKQHKRWQGKDAEFREMKQKYEGVIFGRESTNRNARFVIRDETRLRLAAEGRLPH